MLFLSLFFSTLSLCGLGWLDETEIETIPGAKPVTVAETGEIIEAETKEVSDKQETLEPANITPTVYYTMAKQKNFTTADAKQLLEKHGGDFASAYAELKTI